jgi:hypothetical protein
MKVIIEMERYNLEPGELWLWMTKKLNLLNLGNDKDVSREQLYIHVILIHCCIISIVQETMRVTLMSISY